MKTGNRFAQSLKESESRVEAAIEGKPERMVNKRETAAVVEAKKGVQTNITMSLYKRLNMIKLEQGKSIGDLVEQAIHEFVERNGVG